jgi:undecaprenyl-phosphate 4-deoxy-4-formamido-L-arabinose transferase
MNAQDAPCGISIIIPIYRSAPILPELIARLSTALPTLHRPFELILVNDGSPDNSAPIMTQLAQQHDWIRTINMMRNYGQHNALLCGIRAAAHPICVTMDDDLQHPPEELARLLDALTDSVSVVYGTPAVAEHDLWRNMT